MARRSRGMGAAAHASAGHRSLPWGYTSRTCRTRRQCGRHHSPPPGVARALGYWAARFRPGQPAGDLPEVADVQAAVVAAAATGAGSTWPNRTSSTCMA